MELQEGDLDFKIVKRLGLHPLHYCMIGICKSKYVVTSVDALNKHRQRVHQLGRIPPPQKGRPCSHDSHWPKKDPKKVQENNDLRSFSLEFRMEMALKNLRRRLLEQEICKEKVNYEHELSSEALERFAGHLDAYKSKDIKRREDTLRRIELKKMFSELHCSKEGSSSTIGTNGGACNDYDNEISIESEKNNTHEVQEIVEKIGGLDLDDECSSSIMEGSSNASHEHIIEDYIEQAKQPSKTPTYGDQSSNKTIACEMNEDNYGFIEDCFQSDPQLDDTHDTPHMHITSDSRVNAETSAPQERATKHTKLTPKNLSKVGSRSRVAWLSHMQSNYIGRRKPIRISAIHGNTQCKK